MDIYGIINLLDKNRIPEALEHADKIPFSESHLFTYNRLKGAYIDGLRGQELSDWKGQIQGLVSLYESKFGSYKSDKSLRRWIHLDKKELKFKFKKLCRRHDYPIKVLFIENNTKAKSSLIHEILFSYYPSHFKDSNPSHLKGNMNDPIDLADNDTIKDDWMEFVQSIFGISINIPFHLIPDEFIKKGLHKQTHFVFQSVDRFDFGNLIQYCNLWTTLKPEKSLFLFLHVPEQSMPKDIKSPNFLVCYNNEYEYVEKTDFTRFFSAYPCYIEDLSLCNCERMTFHDAVEELQFSDNNI